MRTARALPRFARFARDATEKVCVVLVSFDPEVRAATNGRTERYEKLNTQSCWVRLGMRLDGLDDLSCESVVRFFFQRLRPASDMRDKRVMRDKSGAGVGCLDIRGRFRCIGVVHEMPYRRRLDVGVRIGALAHAALCNSCRIATNSPGEALSSRWIWRSMVSARRSS